MMAEPPFLTLKAAFSSAGHTNQSTGGVSEQAALFSGLFSLSSSCLEARADNRHPPDHTHSAISDHCLPRQHPYQPGKVPLLNRKVIGCQLIFLFHFRHNPACRNPPEHCLLCKHQGEQQAGSSSCHQRGDGQGMPSTPRHGSGPHLPAR